MPSYQLFAIPSRLWEECARRVPPDRDELLREQLREACAIRDRIASGVNIDSERDRLSSLMSRVEGELISRAGSSQEEEDQSQESWRPTFKKVSVRDSWSAVQVNDELGSFRLPSIRVGEEYLHLLVAIELARAGNRMPGILEPLGPTDLGNPVFEPGLLVGHLASLEEEVSSLEMEVPESALVELRRRNAFLETLLAAGDCGLVEIALPYSSTGLLDAALERPPSITSEVALDRNFNEGDDSSTGRAGRQRMKERLDEEVQAAIGLYRESERVARSHSEGGVHATTVNSTGGADADKDPRRPIIQGGKVNASNQPHDVTTDVFGYWAKRPGKPAQVRIVYSDASEAAPFPLHVLHDRERPAGDPKVIRAALMSMRHLDIDRIVDLAWFRNREVSQARSLAESDGFCFRYSLREFHSLLKLSQREGRPIRLEVYHTGFEPASLGFYRALLAVLTRDSQLLERIWGVNFDRSLLSRPSLIVAPMYFRGGTRYEPSRDPEGQVLEWF